MGRERQYHAIMQKHAKSKFKPILRRNSFRDGVEKNNGSTVNSVDVVRGEMECSLYSIVGSLSKVSTEGNVCLVK